MPAVTPKEKLDALASFCETALEAVRPGLRVETRYRRQTEPNAARRDRIAVMGDPCYYLEIRHAGPTAGSDLRRSGQPGHLGHRFALTLFYQYADAAAYAQSSQATFDALAGALLDSLRQVQSFDGTTIHVGQPEEDAEDVWPLDERGTEAAHVLTFFIELGGRSA